MVQTKFYNRLYLRSPDNIIPAIVRMGGWQVVLNLFNHVKYYIVCYDLMKNSFVNFI